MAFPRLNALSYWVYLASGLFMYAGFAIGAGPNDGWFNYVPNASRAYNPGMNMDFYALGMIFLGISTTVGAANFVVTFLRTRAPGMSVNRVPILIWGTLTASVANIIVVPAVSLAFVLLWMDRQFGTHFFDVSEGGQPLLWQHLFWMFGHPWVYAVVLPAMGMVSDGLPAFCRRPLVGYAPVALSTVATMMLGFGVWVHHMFATGLPNLALSFFSGASIIITVPSAVAVFAWTATIWLGRPVITTAFLYFSSMIVLFVIGGVSGFMTASVPVDWQLTDTYFVVAHLHYVLIGINLFPVIGGLYYWFPKMTGRMLDERLGKIELLDGFHRLQCCLPPDASHWAARHAEAHLHLSARHGLGQPEHAHDGWRFHARTRRPYCYWPTYSQAFAAVPWLVRTRGTDRRWNGRSRRPLRRIISKSFRTSRAGIRCGKGDCRKPLRARRSMRGWFWTTAARPSAPRRSMASPTRSFACRRNLIAPFLLALAGSAFFVGLLLHVWWLALASAVVAALAVLIWLWPERQLRQRVETAACLRRRFPIRRCRSAASGGSASAGGASCACS